jgi:hypothetical protein
VSELLLPFLLDCDCEGGPRGGGRLIGEGRLADEVVPVLLAVEASAVTEGSRFLPHQGGFSVVSSKRVPSKRVPSKRVPSKRVPSRRVSSGWFWVVLPRRVRVLKQVKAISTSRRVQILFMTVAIGRAVTGARGSGSVGA